MDHHAHSEEHDDRIRGGHEAGRHEAHARHDKHAGHSVAMFRDRSWLTLLLTIPTVVWSEMIQHWFGYTAPPFRGSDGRAARHGDGGPNRAAEG